MLLRIDHIDLMVRDVEETRAFLEKLGFQVERSLDHNGLAYEMRLPGDDQVILEFRTAKSQDEIGVRHIAFLVENGDATVSELSSRGVAFTSDWKKVPATGRMVVNCADHDGLKIQLTI